MSVCAYVRQWAPISSAAGFAERNIAQLYLRCAPNRRPCCTARSTTSPRAPPWQTTCQLHTDFMSPRPLGLGMGWWRSAARSRLVTGRSRRGSPFAVTAGHGWSRLVTSLRAASLSSRRRVAGSGPLPLATLESLAHETLDCATEGRLLCAARVVTPLEPLSTAPPSVASLQRRFSAATQRSRRQSKMSQGHIGPLPGSSATPQSAPGSCPGGGQAIGQ